MSSPSNGAGQERFKSLLLARAEASGRDARSAIEDGMAARIRDGRTDAARADQRDPVRAREERAEPRKSDSGAQNDATAGAQREPARERSRSKASDEAGGPDLSSRERATHLTDANDARGSAGDEQGSGADDPDPNDAQAAIAPAAPHVDRPPPTAGGAAARIAPAAGIAAGVGVPAPAVAGAAAAQTNARAEGVLASANAAKGRGAAEAPGTAAPAGRAAAERAEAILEQLKVRIQSGTREATIHLRPADLGRIDMHVKVGAEGLFAAIGAENPETLRVLEAHLPELRAWLSKDAAGPVEITLTLLDGGAAGERGASDRSNTSRSRDGARRSAPAQAVDVPAALGRALSSTTNTEGVDLVA